MFKILSQKQDAIVFPDFKRVTVRACPGSGKTFTVAARLANKIGGWKDKNIGIACLSFTNVAWEEIERFSVRFGTTIPIRHPHFLGTIDSFVNRFIFLPFGHLVMGCQRRPILVGEPYGVWAGRYFSEQWFDKSSFDINGNFIFTRSYPPPPIKSAQAVCQAKHNLFKAGYANQDDANFFSLKILREYPDITRSLVVRFPVLLIDEAQDTTAIQMAIIDEFVKTGAEEIFLVGDPDQAIFEWNTADPKLFQSKCKEWECIPLDECRRSSQKICDFVYPLSSLDKPALAVTPEISNCIIQPIVMEYTDRSILIKDFLKSCENGDTPINKENVAILSRSKKKVSEVAKILNEHRDQGTINVSNPYEIWDENFYWCKDLCEGKFLIDKGIYKEGYKLIERGCYKGLNQAAYFSKENLVLYIRNMGFIKWRYFVHEIIKTLPSTSSNLSDWLSLFLPIAQKFFGITNLNGAIKNVHATLSIQSIFTQTEILFTNLPVRLGTIHSVKGETFEAVLVVMDSKAGNTKYATIMKRCKKGDLLEEELRNIYVAITRPRKILTLGVPQGEGDLWNKFLQ